MKKWLLIGGGCLVVAYLILVEVMQPTYFPLLLSALTTGAAYLPAPVPVAAKEYIQGSIDVQQQSIAMTITSAAESTIGPVSFRWSCGVQPGGPFRYVGYAINTSLNPTGSPARDSGLRGPLHQCTEPWVIKRPLASGNIETVSISLNPPAHLRSGATLWFVFFDGNREVQTETGGRAAVVVTVDGPPVTF